MVIDYKSQSGLQILMSVLDEYVVWYGKLMKSYFEGNPVSAPPPAAFQEWLAYARAENNISESAAEKIVAIHEGMIQAASRFVLEYQYQERPLKEYADLTGHYEEFIQMMHRLEFDKSIENSGYDERTGLRSPRLMKDDLSRELERRARRGNPFALVLIKINNFDPSWMQNQDAFWTMVKKIAHHIKLGLRSFDDAYYLGDEYFLLSIKHADIVGSQSAINRFNNAVAAAHITMPNDPLSEISISSVISEPAPGDTMDDLILNMKEDLQDIDSRGTILQYNDISPLQRYIHSIGKDK